MNPAKITIFAHASIIQDTLLYSSTSSMHYDLMDSLANTHISHIILK